MRSQSLMTHFTRGPFNIRVSPPPIDRFTRPTPPINVKPSPSFSTHIRSPDPPPPPPPPFPKDLLKKEKKREVFL